MGLEVTSIQKGQLSQATEAVDQTLLLLKTENFKNHIGTVSFALPPVHSKVESQPFISVPCTWDVCVCSCGCTRTCVEIMGSPQMSSSPLFSILVYEAGSLAGYRGHRWLELWAASPESLLLLPSAGVKGSAITHWWVLFFTWLLDI